MTLPHITDAQRRIRLGVRHALASPVRTIAEAADAMVVLHATDPASVYLSAHARSAELDVPAIQHALHDERTVLRTLAMRRTLFIGSASRIPVIEASSSPDVARTERKVLEKALAGADIGDPAAWLDAAFEEVLEALTPGGQPARTITKLVPRLQQRVILGGGKHTIDSGATSRTLGLMAVEGHIARGRVKNWTTRNYNWHRRDHWFPHPTVRPDPDEAAVTLLTWWLETFGPGTLNDMKWWTGWTVTKTRKTLSAIETAEVALDSGDTGYVLADDIADQKAPDPWVALLPSLDPTAMGWKDRSWYVGDHHDELFDRFGNIGPTIWADGHLVGIWGQDPDGVIEQHLLAKVTGDQKAAIAAETTRVQDFVGDTIVKPSFPTPRQKAIASG